jgi:hypothetical protein
MAETIKQDDYGMIRAATHYPATMLKAEAQIKKACDNLEKAVVTQYGLHIHLCAKQIGEEISSTDS